MLSPTARFRLRGRFAAALLLTGWCATGAFAFFPQSQPPFPPPTGVEPLPPIIVPDPPPVVGPVKPPVHNTPEPGTISLALIGAGVAAFTRKRARSS
jgi:hypothetical protein